MMTRIVSPLWKTDQPFCFEVERPLNDVLAVMASLNTSHGDESQGQVIVSPNSKGFSFRYDLKRQSKDQTQVAAFAEGDIWQDQNGVVVVEGIAKSRSDAPKPRFNVLIALGFASLLMLVWGLTGLLALLGAGGLMLFVSSWESQRVIDEIESVLGDRAVSERQR